MRKASKSKISLDWITPSLRDDSLLFFDRVAFADNPDWSDCYYSAYHFVNKGKAESRREASSLIEGIGCTIPRMRQRKIDRLAKSGCWSALLL